METYMTNFFNRTYTLIKLSLMFWGITFAGGIILGIGPAFLTVSQLFDDYQWEQHHMKWNNLWKLFLQNFKDGNIIFYQHALLIAILSYNFYLAVQIKGIGILFIQFILASAFVLTVISYFVSISIFITFDISYVNLFKLSWISILSHFFNVIKLSIGLIILGIITFKYMGLLLFLTVGVLVVINQWGNKSIVKNIDAHIS